MLRRSFIAVGVASATFVSTSVQAATLADASGAVLVNEGAGFRAGVISQTLAPGSQVMVRGTGQARVSYPDFCVFVVEPGRVYTVTEQSPCALGAQPTAGDLLPHDYTIAVGVGVAAAVGVGVLIASQSGKSSK